MTVCLDIPGTGEARPLRSVVVLTGGGMLDIPPVEPTSSLSATEDMTKQST